MFIYEGHMGSLFTTEEELDYEQRYCEQCGDSDWLLGEINSREDAIEILKDSCFSEEYIREFLDQTFGS